MTEKSALEGLKVLDLSNLRTGAQVSQFLADFGAEVIHVETPGGSPLRAEAAWPFWARGKRSIQLDLKDSDDLSLVKKLAGNSDVVLETFRPSVADRLGLSYEELSANNPGLVYASINGFGSKGPLANLQGYEGIVFAKLGVLWTVEGMANRPGPCFPSAAYASYPSSQLALQGIMAALIDREDSGIGQKLETSMVQGLTVHDTFQWFSRVLAMRYSDGVKTVPRVVDGIPTGGLSFRLLIALTKDGQWLQFSQTVDRLFKAMMELFELDWMFDDPRWKSAPDFEDVQDRLEFWEILLNVVRTKTADEWSALFDEHPNVWAERFRKKNELLDHPQMQWNKMVATVPDKNLGTVRQPGVIARLDGTPAIIDRPPPNLGEHDEVIRTEAMTSHENAAIPATTKTPPSDNPPLEGVTIVELGTYYAAPYATTLMAELGARVIKLEQLDGDPNRKLIPFPEVAGIKALQGKECVGIDLGSEKGREIARHIISKSDVVLQSFRAGAAERLGLDADAMLALNPNLIYHSSPGYGEDGPCGGRPAFAPTIGAGAGLAWRNAGPGIPEGADLSLDEIKPASLQLSTAVMGVGNSDGISAVTAGTAMILGILARKRGAGGQKILTTMLSSNAHSLSEVMLDYKDMPYVQTADLGAHGFDALYRLYEAGDDEWVFLAAPSQAEWDRLLNGLGDAGMALGSNLLFADANSRANNDDALVQELSNIFRTQPANSWEEQLRACDVACVVAERGPVEQHYMDEGKVGDICDLVTTAHHPMLDEIPRLKPLVKFSRSGTVAGDAGMVGQDTEKVLRDYGYSEDDINRLSSEGVIALG